MRMMKRTVLLSLTLPAVLAITLLGSVGAVHAEEPESNPAAISHASLIEADETWDSEAAILSQRDASLDESEDGIEAQGYSLWPACPKGEKFMPDRAPGAAVSGMAGTGKCVDLRTMNATGLFEDEPDEVELQRAALMPVCSPGSVFVYTYGALGTSTLNRVLGKCVDAPPVSAGAAGTSLLEEEDDGPAEARADTIVATTAFDVDAGCVATIDNLADGGDTHVQTCAEDLSGLANDVIRYEISGDVDTPLVLSTCLLAHPEEVSGDGAQCGSSDSVGSDNVGADSASAQARGTAPVQAVVATVAVTPAAVASAAVAAWAASPAPTASVVATATPLAPVAVTGTVYTIFNGFLVGETQVGADGIADVVIAGLPEGVHDVTLVFDPAQSGLESTFMEVSVKSAPTSSAGEAVNSMPLLITLGIALILAVLAAIWLLVGGRVHRAKP